MMLNRIFKAPEQSFFLLGPRGIGKSTWLRAIYPNAYVIDLLSEETYQRLLAALFHGRTVNVSNIAREAGLTRTA